MDDLHYRISDRGGGIRHDLVKKVWDYGFTSAAVNVVEDRDDRPGLFGAMCEDRGSGKMFG